MLYFLPESKHYFINICLTGLSVHIPQPCTEYIQCGWKGSCNQEHEYEAIFLQLQQQGKNLKLEHGPPGLLYILPEKSWIEIIN